VFSHYFYEYLNASSEEQDAIAPAARISLSLNSFLNMSNATNTTTPRKRIRIDENIIEIDASSNTPKLLYNLYSGVLVSLQPTIRHVSDFYFKILTSALKEVENYKDKLKKFDENESFIPRSCRTSFTVGASNLVKGSATYTTLLSTIENNNKIIAEQNRDYVRQVIQLELDEATNKLRNTFCDSLYKLATIFLHNGYFGSEITANSIHAAAKNIIIHQPAIVRYIFDTNINDFKQWYNKKFNITVAVHPPVQRTPIITALLPGGSRNIDDYNPSEGERASYLFAEDQTPGSGLDMLLAWRRQRTDDTTDNNDDDTQGPDNNILKLTDHDVGLFSTLMYRMTTQHWSTLLQQHHSKYVNAQLTKLAETLITSDVTNQAAAIIAAQPPASEAIISELIDQKFKALEQKWKTNNAPKNVKRGEKTTRATIPKKSKTTRQTTNAKNNAKPKEPTPNNQTSAHSRPPRRGQNTKTKPPTGKQQQQPQTPKHKRKAEEPGRATTNGKKTTSKTKKKPKTSASPTPHSTKSNRSNGTNRSRKQKSN
jgi:hypothetical protein